MLSRDRDTQIQQDLREGNIRVATDGDKTTMWDVAMDVAKGAAVAAVPVVLIGTAIVLSGGTLGIGAIALGGVAIAVGGATGGVRAYKRRIKFSSAGLILPDMEIERLEDEVDPETNEKHAVLQLEHIRILDQKVFDKAIDIQERYKDNPDYIAITPDFKNEPEYSVKITIRGKEITLAELDYTNWENNPDFKIEITKPKVDPQTKKPVKPTELLEITEEEKQRVLETLGGMSKFLGDQLQHPDELVEEAIDVGDKQKVNMQAPPSAAIQSDVFWEGLADVAIRTGKYEIFTRYEKAIKETSEKTDSIDILKKNAEAKTAKNYPLNSTKWRRILAIASLACLALAAVSAAGVAVVLFAPISIPTIALGIIVNTLVVVSISGLVAAVASFSVSKFLSYFTNSAASYEAAATIAKVVKSAHEISQEERFAGVQKTQEMIKALSTQNKDIATLVAQDQAYKAPGLTLDLSKQGVGNSSAIIVGRWINTRHAKFCHTLILSNNRITDDGAVSLAKGLATATNVREIDIAGNKIGDKGLRAFSEALAKNPAIRKFAYDKEGIAPDIINKIERELLVNNFLFNPDPNNAELQKGITEFFAGDLRAFEQEAATKIKQLQTLPRMAAFINSFPENIQAALQDDKDNEIKKAVNNLKNAVIERQVELLFHGKPLTKDPNELDQALITYIDVYNAATEPATLAWVDQKQVLSLIKNSLAGPDVPGAKEQLEMRTPSTSQGLKALLNLDEQKRISLLSNCFANETLRLETGDARGMAMFISSAISTEGFYDPQATSRAILELRKCLILVKKMDDPKRSTLDEYTAYLEAKIEAKKGEFKDSPEDVAIIESALQAAYQGKAEGQFACLLPPFSKPSEEKLAEFKEYLKNNTKIRNFKFPEPNNIDPEVTLAIKETCKRNQILEVLKQPHSEATLKKFLEIYGTMQDPEYLRTAKFDLAGLIKLISLNEDVLTTDSDIYKMVESLRTLSKPACRVLLEIYFQGQKEWGIPVNHKDKALLVTAMIKSDGFTAMLSRDYPHPKVLESMPIDILKDAFNYRTSSSHFVHDYAQLIEILNANIIYRLNEEPVDELIKAKEVYEEVLQLTLQEKLEAEYPCLRQPFKPDATGKFLTELDDNFYLRKFDFTGKEALDPAIKAGIDKTIARNKLFDEIHYALIHSRTADEKEEAEIEGALEARLDTGFALLIAAYKKDPNTFIDYFKRNPDEASYAQDLIMTNIYKLLEEEDVAACNNLLKLCFDPKDKEADFKAALITNIISYLPFLSDTEINKILDLAQRKDKADLQGIFIKSGETALQQIWLQTELELKYECLRNDSTTDLTKLKQELDGKLLNNNHDLIYFVIPEGKLNEETVEYINSICNRNILERCVNREKPDLNIFIGRLNELSPADCQKLVATIDKNRMVKLFKDVNIEDLRKLDKELTVILLEKYFASVPAAENAHEKAVIIAELLHSEDPGNKAINEIIEYAVKPWAGAASAAASALNYLTWGKLQRSHLADEPYYNLSELQTKLEKIHAESPTHRPELPQSTIQESDVVQTMGLALMPKPKIASAPVPKGVELALESALLPPAKPKVGAEVEAVERPTNTPTDL